MGEIARYGTDDALALFRKVILASAAIPGALPPVSIPVVAGGKSYDELHVDGGTTREVFVLPVQAPFKAFDPLYSAPPIRKLYIIKNGKLTPETEVTQPKTLSIAARAISTLIKSQNLTELYRIYRLSQDAGADFHLLAVPPDFTMKAKEFFDPEYQAALFAEGEKIGRAGGPWLKSPVPSPVLRQWR
jgi:predicted acylesterase/phospholipase RssA